MGKIVKEYRINIKGYDFGCVCRIQMDLFDTLQEMADSTKELDLPIKYKNDVIIPVARARAIKTKGDERYKNYLCGIIQFSKDNLDDRIIYHEAYHAILECFRIAKDKDFSRYEENIVDSSSILGSYLYHDLKEYIK